MIADCSEDVAEAYRDRAAAAPRLRTATIHFAVALAVSFYLWRLIGPFDRFPGTTIDARFNQVVLEHLWLWVSGRADSLADPAFFYPYRGVFYLSDAHLGSGWIYAILRALGAPREIAFDLWFVAGMASTFAAAAYAFRRFGLPAAGAAVAALVFAFALPMLAQDTHAQLVYRFAVPLATLACVEFLRAPSLRQGAALGLWVGWQFLCSVYIGVFLCEWLVFVAAFAWLAPPPQPSPVKGQAVPVVLGVAAALALGLAAYMLWRHAEIARAYAIHRDVAEIGEMAPRWASLLSMAGAPTIGWLSAWLPHHTSMWDWEHQLFPGLGVLLLAGAGAARGRGPVVALCLVASAGLLAFNLDVNGAGLWRYTSQLPGLNAIRSPGRVAIVVAFPLAWLAGLGVVALRRSARQAAFAVLAVGLGLALTDIAAFRSASTPIATARARVAAMEAGLDDEALRAKRAVLLRFGADSNEQETMRDLDLMIAAQDLGVRAVNGYSGSVPPLYARPRDCAEAKALAGRLDALPFKRAGAEDVGSRVVIVPVGACAEPPPP